VPNSFYYKKLILFIPHKELTHRSSLFFKPLPL
jgi:hypothetical protein